MQNKFARSVARVLSRFLRLAIVFTVLPQPAPSAESVTPGSQQATVGQSASLAVPRYKPYSRAQRPMDITSDNYGASSSAPNALGVGDFAPDFSLPRAGGGTGSLAKLRKLGPVAIIFYRGHW